VTNERPMAWWWCWLRRRTIDDYRAWHGRRVYRAHVPPSDYLLPKTSFEDGVVDRLDFKAAWPLLSPVQHYLLTLTAAGYSDKVIGRMVGKTQNAVALHKTAARKILRSACAVKED